MFPVVDAGSRGVCPVDSSGDRSAGRLERECNPDSTPTGASHPETDPATPGASHPETDPETAGETDPETHLSSSGEADAETDPETAGETDAETHLSSSGEARSRVASDDRPSDDQSGQARHLGGGLHDHLAATLFGHLRSHRVATILHRQFLREWRVDSDPSYPADGAPDPAPDPAHPPGTGSIACAAPQTASGSTKAEPG